MLQQVSVVGRSQLAGTVQWLLLRANTALLETHLSSAALTARVSLVVGARYETETAKKRLLELAGPMTQGGGLAPTLDGAAEADADALMLALQSVTSVLDAAVPHGRGAKQLLLLRAPESAQLCMADVQPHFTASDKSFVRYVGLLARPAPSPTSAYSRAHARCSVWA